MIIADRSRALLLRAALLLALLLLPACTPPADPDEARRSEIRYIPDGDLAIIDPYVSTASVTVSHAYMVYDTLYALDSQGQARPQMVDSAVPRADRRVWRFTLRPGLAFHDGRAVTSRDVVASIRRWLQVSLYSEFVNPALEVVRPLGTNGFEMRFRRPMPNLPDALAEPTRPLFIMREKDAMLPATTPVSEAVGSGPFIMERDRWLRGSRIHYRRNPAYRPRPEPADGYAGGKRVNVDRVTWLIVKDPNTALQALGNDEVDIIEAPHPDLLGLLRDDPAIGTSVINRLGQALVMRPNSLAPPLDNPAIRRVLLYAVEQREFLAVTGVSPSNRQVCWRILSCSGRYGTDDGLGGWTNGRAPPADTRRMLRAAGYRGEPIVILNPVDLPLFSAAALVAGQSLRDAGFNVDLQTVDGNSFMTRRAIKAAPAVNPGGWHLFLTLNSGSNVENAALNPGVASACDGKGWFGWPCDPELTTIRREFFFATSDAQRLAAARRLQRRFYQSIPYVPLGEIKSPIAHRHTIDGFIETPRVVFWGLRHQAWPRVAAPASNSRLP